MLSSFSLIEIHNLTKALDGSIQVKIIEAIHAIFKEKLGQSRGLMGVLTFFGLAASTDAHDIAAINGHFSAAYNVARYGMCGEATKNLFTNIIREKQSIDRRQQESTYRNRWGLTNDALSVKITEAIAECIRKRYISQDEIDRITREITTAELALSSSPKKMYNPS